MPGPSRSVRHRDRDVDTARERSVSFAPPETRPPLRPTTERQPVPVGPGRPWDALPRSGPLPDEALGYPVQLAKVQPPALRDETLERPRLLDWLHTKINRRVVLILADAGYGKTTLLADFSRRTRLPTLWYRLDDDDRDWVSLLHHLVAAGREHLADFAPQTLALLTQAGVGGPERDEVLNTFIGELPQIAGKGAILIFDDYHQVDDAADVRFITRELLTRAPERLTVVFASRRQPAFPIAKLRSAGEIAELGTDDLRFDVTETTLLFNETYGRNLESDVLADLTTRTEGWAASLHLVQAALRDRSSAEIRRFVRGLTGADHDLYDYLAEEVVGDLPEELQRFLMETSILQVVTPEMAEVASGMDAQSVTSLRATAERLTLLTRVTGSPRTHQRYHPLVREFLEARLRATRGEEAFSELHARVASAAVASDWRVAAYHYREAGDSASMLGVVGGAIPAIMGNGQYALAQAFIDRADPETRAARFDLILSRVDMQDGDYAAAIAASNAVLEAATDQVERDHALLNLVTLYLNYGDGDSAVVYAEQLRSSQDANLAMIAEASAAMVTGSEVDDLDRINRLLVTMSRSQRDSRPHHFAITQYNLASNYLLQDRPAQALIELEPAIEILEAGSARIELAAARVLRAEALAMLGRGPEARDAIDLARGSGSAHQEDEIAIRVADVYDTFLDPGAAGALYLGLEGRRGVPPSGRRLEALSRTRMLIRRARYSDASRALASYPSGRPAHLGIESALRVTRAYLAVADRSETARALADEALKAAQDQSAHRWRRCGEILLALTGPDEELSVQVAQTGSESPQTLTYLADVLVDRLHALGELALKEIYVAAGAHPERWRVVLRDAVDRRSPAAVACAQLLDRIGEKQDVRRLRNLSREFRRRTDAFGLGRSLARRLADPVYVEDQGRVSFRIGPRVVAGSEVRRKVLALVCFLLTRPKLSSTRDQVLEAIWPDLDPDVAVNSLNQTLYFLRRVFEEEYEEDLSPGYVHHDSDVIWFDPELVTSRSTECRALIRDLPNSPSPDEVERLVQAYQGRFALDFEYEDWTSAHRDLLHAAYLEIIERSILDDFASGHYDRGIRIARRALEIDNSAENIEVSLLRLYRVTRAHSAAAEQYAHYASVLRDELGLDPPPLESL